MRRFEAKSSLIWKKSTRKPSLDVERSPQIQRMRDIRSEVRVDWDWDWHWDLRLAVAETRMQRRNQRSLVQPQQVRIDCLLATQITLPQRSTEPDSAWVTFDSQAFKTWLKELDLSVFRFFVSHSNFRILKISFSTKISVWMSKKLFFATIST